MSEKHITRTSLSEMRRTKSRTDWERLRREGDYGGAPEFEVDWTKAKLVEPLPKKLISLRIDKDVLEFFRAQGKGYQTRINAVLRAYKEAQERSD
ncbi:hypothetical protein DDZ14_05015 [Maritimibacter sp. 55A14]|nr:hypothetical protein DDZ14_05015 [Maritimibacter sp. 55A14]